MQEFLLSVWRFIQDFVLDPLSNLPNKLIGNVLDIAVLTMLLYLGYLFLKNRRGSKLVVGMALVVALYILCQILDMKTTSLILRNIYTVGLIAIVVIFQPELRDMLEKVGSAPMRLRKINGGGTDVVMDTVEQIVQATCTMSAKGKGALMVFERTTKLGEYISRGVPLDASIKSELLDNIFHDKAPLHDGALVIRDLRIVAASCKLPLSSNDVELKHLGTRHRAAVGITEVSDAFVIVVSEESGIISIANNGHLKRNYKYESLQEDVYRLLTGKEPPKTRFGDSKQNTLSDGQINNK